MSSTSLPGFSLLLAGRPRVRVGDGTILDLQPMDAALLVWLALQGATPRGRLAELLWPASAPESARGALRQRLYKLRQQLGAELVSGSTTLALADGAVHDLDGEHGPLDGLALEVGGEFDQWLAHERQRRRLSRRRRHLEGIDAAEAAGDLAAALERALAWLDAEPELEAAHRRTIRLHYLLGDRRAALAAYERCAAMLERAHGGTPDDETRALRALLDGLAAATPGSGPARGDGARRGGDLGGADGRPSMPSRARRPSLEAEAADGVASARGADGARGGGRPEREAPTDARADGLAATTPRPLADRPGPGALPAALLRPPRLVGRDAEAAAALAAWAEGKVVALVAEAGMGKTRLLQHLLPPAAERSIYVAARPGDAGVPLATLSRLVRALAPAPEALEPGAWAVLEGVMPPPAADASRSLGHAGATATPAAATTTVPALVAARPPASPDGDRQRLQRAMQALIDARPALAAIAIDDLHFADGASLRLLQGLLEEPPGSTAAPRRLQWALGYRPAEADGTLHDLHDALTDSMRVQALALPALSVPALAELVDTLGLPGLVGAEWAEWLHRRTGGNPMFVLETLKQHALAGGLGRGLALDRAPSPVSVRRLIERRLAQLSPAALALARCAAVAGTDFDLALASAVLETPALALADAWAELEAAGVLRDQAFAHDLVHETALASLPGPIARHLHGQIAERLEAAGRAPPGTLARHWLAAAQPDRARPHLERAAEAAAQAYDAVESGRLLLQLADLHEAAGRGGDAFAAAMAAANAHRSHHTGAAADGAIDRMEALARTANERAAVFKQRAELALARGDIESAAAHTEAGIAALPADAPPGQRAALLNSLGIQLRRTGRLGPARHALESALALLRGLPPGTEELASVLNNLGLVLQELDDHLRAIPLMQEAAECQPDPMTRARVMNNIAISLEERGQVQLAYDQRLAAVRAVAGSGSVVELNLTISLGSSARNLHRFRDALVHLERARAIGDGQRFQREQDLHRQFAALWLALGRFNLAREAIDRAEAATVDVAAMRAVVGLVRGRWLALTRQPAAAAEVLARARAALEVGGEQRSLRRIWVVEAMVQPPEQALARMDEALAHPTVAGNAGAALPLVVRRAQALDALGRPAEALREAQRAADWLQAVQPLDLSPAEVWLTLARAADGAGDRAAARQAAATGLAFVERIAAEHLDELYRDSWRRQNPVNAALAALAARLERG